MKRQAERESRKSSFTQAQGILSDSARAVLSWTPHRTLVWRGSPARACAGHPGTATYAPRGPSGQLMDLLYSQRGIYVAWSAGHRHGSSGRLGLRFRPRRYIQERNVVALPRPQGTAQVLASPCPSHHTAALFAVGFGQSSGSRRDPTLCWGGDSSSKSSEPSATG